jgi:uncharacterized delta-60 repeat protein
MPYIIDSITAETINVNQELLVDGQEVPIPSYINNGDSSINTNIDWSNGIIQELNLDNDPTLTFSNGLLGQTSTLLLKQQLSGLRFITWPSDVIWNGGNPVELQTLAGAGSVDDSFNIGTGFNNSVNDVKIQSDGKILVGGAFTSYNGTSRNRIIRLNPDGSIDNSFNIGSGFGGASTSVDTISIQQDGKIIVGGSFTSYSGASRNRIIRLNSDGSIDNSFNIGSGFNSYITSTAIQQDGKILVVGPFTSYNGTTSNYFIRLNSDGSIDNSLNIGTGFGPEFYSPLYVSIQTDGKILVGGFFESYNGTTSRGIARLNPDGIIDSTFNTGTGFKEVDGSNEYVDVISIQSDGKIIAGGDFSSYNGTPSNRIARLNPDGSIDNTFNVGTGFNDVVWEISIQSDGKILVGGQFTSYNGITRYNIIRINSDGSVDNTFDIGTGFFQEFYGPVVYSISILPDKKILVGGVFETYNGTTTMYIVSINGLDPLAYNKVEFDYNGIYYIGSY